MSPTPETASPGARIVRDYVRISDGQLHVRRAGELSGAVPPLFLLHPSPNTSRNFTSLMARLGRSRFVVAVDTPGFGESFRPERPPAIADYARWIAEAPRAMGFDRFDVLGQFTGAGTAVEIARQSPDAVRRLVLAAPPLFTPAQQAGFTENAWPMRPREDGGNLMFEWGRVIARGQPQVPLSTKLDTFVDYYRGGANAIWGEQAIAAYPLREALPHVRQRTLVIKPQSVFGDAAGAQALLPDSELIEIDVSGYVMMGAHAEHLATIIDAFLASPERPEPEASP